MNNAICSVFEITYCPNAGKKECCDIENAFHDSLFFSRLISIAFVIGQCLKVHSNNNASLNDNLFMKCFRFVLTEALRDR